LDGPDTKDGWGGRRVVERQREVAPVDERLVVERQREVAPVDERLVGVSRVVVPRSVA